MRAVFQLRADGILSLICVPVHSQTLRPSQHLLGQLSKVLRLNPVQEVVLAFALTNSSQTDTAQFAEQFARQKLPDLLKACLDSGELPLCLPSDLGA